MRPAACVRSSFAVGAGPDGTRSHRGGGEPYDACVDAHLPTPDLAAEDRLPADLLGALRRLPKAELHLHLDGSVRPATALALARERGIDLGPSVDVARARLVAPMPCPDQARLLDAFDLPIAILQDAESLARVTEELVADIAADGTRYAEIRWAPGLHTARGLALRDGIAAVARGASSIRSRLASSIWSTMRSSIDAPMFLNACVNSAVE